MEPIGRVDALVIDGADTVGLATFWAAMFGPDGSMAHVEALGGRVVHPVRAEYGWDYAVMGDPESNEFCLIRRSVG